MINLDRPLPREFENGCICPHVGEHRLTHEDCPLHWRERPDD